MQHVNEVGSHIGDFLLSIQEHIPLSRISIVGHSLGAHVAGAVGRRTNGQIDAIFGIDPAHPLMTLPMRPTEERLDASDAKFVQILHTSSGTLGTPYNIGHQDWFADNGGRAPQNGCFIFSFSLNAFALSILCSHMRGLEIFRFALQPGNQFKAFRSDDIYGFWSHRIPGVYHFSTTRDPPYVKIYKE